MRRDLTALIVDEIHDERRRIRAEDTTMVRALALLTRTERVRLAAELALTIEEIDQAQAQRRAAEIRRAIQGDDDDVLRAPFGRGKVG